MGIYWFCRVLQPSTVSEDVQMAAASGLLFDKLLTGFGCSTPEALQPPPEIVQATLKVTVYIIFIDYTAKALNSAALRKHSSNLMQHTVLTCDKDTFGLSTPYYPPNKFTIR